MKLVNARSIADRYPGGWCSTTVPARGPLQRALPDSERTPLLEAIANRFATGAAAALLRHRWRLSRPRVRRHRSAQGRQGFLHRNPPPEFEQQLDFQ